MTAEKIILDGLSEISGLDTDELNGIKDLKLFENGILDSLSLASMISYIEKETGKTIDIRSLTPSDIGTINSLICLVDNLL